MRPSVRWSVSETRTAYCWAGPMEPQHDLLGQLRTEWARVARTSSSRIACREFLERHVDLPPLMAQDMGDVVRRLEPRGGLRVEQRALVVTALLEDADDPMIHRALLQTLLPGIVSVTRQLRFGRGIVDAPHEALDQALTLATELLTDWAGQSRAYAAPDVLSALRGRLRRWLLKEKEARAAVVADIRDSDIAPDNDHLLRRLEVLAHGPQSRLARLTYARVYEGVSLRDLAAADRSAPRSLQAELQQFATRFLL